jgi:hypothetical protein
VSNTAPDLFPCCHQGDRDRLHTRTAAPPKPGRCLGCGKAAWTAYCPVCCPAPVPDREPAMSWRYRRDDPGANGRGPAVVLGEDLEGRETI